jgi:hypothetical protein
MPSDDRGPRLKPRTHLDSASASFVEAPAEAKDIIKERKRKHEAINQEITKAGGWVISRPGLPEIDFEILPGNPLPRQLRFECAFDGYGERILPHSKVELFTKNADGTLSLLAEGSTQAVTSRVTHAGIHKTERYWFNFEKKPVR